MKKFRRFKLIYELYNIVNYKRLKYQLPLYKKYNLKKSYYQSLSSLDFPSISEHETPWLDHLDSQIFLPQDPGFQTLDKESKEAILNWSDEGFAILKGFFNSDIVDTVNTLLSKLIEDKKLRLKEGRKYMFAVRYSDQIKALANPKKLTDIVDLLMGRPADLFQSVNFLKGSEDPAHSDFIHMSTYPYGYLIAVWIALEDINEDNGPLFYYPGSHKLPYMMNKDFSHGGNKWLLGKNYKKEYTKKIESVLQDNNFEKKVFTAKKGDVLIWHANLLHGGSPVIDQLKTRKSMVLHYFGRDVIRYHEITERPCLLDIN